MKHHLLIGIMLHLDSVIFMVMVESISNSKNVYETENRNFYFSRLPSKDETDPISGYGFELTFRLRKAPENSNSVQDIPLWPCKLMQYLAKYVFKTGTQFHAGHHIPFGHVLPNLCTSPGDTRIHDLLIINDRQLKSFRTNLGSVEFLQVYQFVSF